MWLDSKQVYLGGFATEDDAARAYDLAAVGCKGPSVEINFPAADYAEALRTDRAGLSQAGAPREVLFRSRICLLRLSIRQDTLQYRNALWPFAYIYRADQEAARSDVYTSQPGTVKILHATACAG